MSSNAGDTAHWLSLTAAERNRQRLSREVDATRTLLLSSACGEVGPLEDTKKEGHRTQTVSSTESKETKCWDASYVAWMASLDAEEPTNADPPRPPTCSEKLTFRLPEPPSRSNHMPRKSLPPTCPTCGRGHWPDKGCAFYTVRGGVSSEKVKAARRRIRLERY